MTVNTLSCGHCPRDDFESFDDLREHVEDCADDDDGGETRTCRDCGITVPRRQLVANSNGVLACPACGNVVEKFAVDLTDTDSFVLVLGAGASNHDSYHTPKPGEPLTTLCDAKHPAQSTFKPRNQSRLPDRYEHCRHCQRELGINDPDEVKAERVTIDLDQTVWYSSQGDRYHTHTEAGLPGCPDVIPNADQHTLREARDAGKTACLQCHPVDYEADRYTVEYHSDDCEAYNQNRPESKTLAGALEDARLHNFLIHGIDSENSPCAMPATQPSNPRDASNGELIADGGTRSDGPNAITRRQFLGVGVAAALPLAAGCASAEAEDRVCTGDCGVVKNWTVDEEGGGLSQATTSVTIEMARQFTGTISVTFRDMDTGELEVANEKEVESKTVVLFEFNGSYESYSDAYLTVEESEVDSNE